MDWFSTIIGAAIGFVSSIGIIFVQRIIDRVGKIEIYAKVVYNRSTGSYTWGFRKNADGVFLNVPLWIEIQNLSNSTRILRDINLLLVSDGKELVTMIQSNRTESKEQGFYLYANEGSYSLSLGGGEIKKIDCLFLLKGGSDIPSFDEISLRYYDEKNRAHIFSLGHVEGDWIEKDFSRSGEWIKLKEKERMKRRVIAD